MKVVPPKNMWKHTCLTSMTDPGGGGGGECFDWRGRRVEVGERDAALERLEAGKSVRLRGLGDWVDPEACSPSTVLRRAADVFHHRVLLPPSGGAAADCAGQSARKTMKCTPMTLREVDRRIRQHQVGLSRGGLNEYRMTE